MKHKSVAGDDVREFIYLIANNFELVSIPPELILFSHSKFKIYSKSLIEELIFTIAKYVKSLLSGRDVSVEQLMEALPINDQELKNTFIRIMNEEKSQLIKIVCRVIEFMPALKESTCERMSDKEFILNLKVQIDPKESSLESQSYALTEEQIACLIDDMNVIRQQLFRSLEA